MSNIDNKEPLIILRKNFDFATVAVCTAPQTENTSILASLHPAERKQASNITNPTRRHEFILSRWLARTLTQASSPVLRGDRSPPQWPAGFRGSISHKCGLALVAVVDWDRKLFVGVDIEGRNSVGAHLDSKVLVGGEPKIISDMSNIFDSMTLRALVFSFKESLYKALNPLENTFFWFHDAEVTHICPHSCTIKARLRKKITSHHQEGDSITGQFLMLRHLEKEFVVTVVSTNYPTD